MQETRIGPLYETDVNELGAAWARIDDLVRSLPRTAEGEAPALNRSPDDLDHVHGLLEAKSITTSDQGLLQDMGVVLGFVLNAVEPRLVWVVVDDEDGRSLGLHYRESEILLFPMTMFSKRVERGEALSVRGIFDGILAQLEELGAGGGEG